jgi:hypothetical protein
MKNVPLARVCGLFLLLVASPGFAAVPLVEVSGAAGIDLVSDPLGAVIEDNIQPNYYGSGFSWADVNTDGWPDLIVSNGGVGRSIFLNNGDGTFDDVSSYFNRNEAVGSSGVAAADMDNDGYLDLAFSNYFAEPFVYEGGRQRFAEKAETLGLRPLLFQPGQEPPNWNGPESTGVAWGDFDADGFVDLYFATYRLQSDMLARSLGGDYFQRTDKVYQNTAAWGFQPVFWDFDDDNDLDIYVANDFGRNFLFVNQGPDSGWQFLERAAQYKVSGGGGFPAPSSLSMGVAVGDYDNDLDLDLYITNYNENELYANEGPYGDGLWRFSRQAVNKGVQYLLNCWGTEFFDAENDGDLDLILTGGWIPSDPILDQGRNIDNKFYLNDGAPDYTFTDVTASSGFSEPDQSGRGLAVADYDRDGDLDVAVWNLSHYDVVTEQIDQVGTFQLYRNDQNDGNHWAVFKLQGGGPHGAETGCNRSGVGARVYLTTAAGTQMREVRAGGSYLSQSSIEVEFGLGSQTSIDEVRVRWMCGAEEEFTGCEVDRFYKLVEGKGTPDPLPAAVASFAAEWTDEGMHLSWSQAAWLQIEEVTILRAPAGSDAFQPLSIEMDLRADGGDALDSTAEVGSTYRYRLELRGGLTTAHAMIEARAGRVLPQRPRLGQNFPNPFNPGTTILFTLPERMHVTLELYDSRGRHVTTLLDEVRDAGENSLPWDGNDADGRKLASGVYRYVLQTDAGSQSRSLTLVR